MRLIPCGPDLPAELVTAQERGETLFVCGAGVSRAVGLPSFEGLVKGVYTALGEDWQAHRAEDEIMRSGGRLTGQYDRALRALERRLIGTDIRKAQTWRERVRAAVSANLAPPANAELTDHLCLLELSRDAEHRNRLLTTNFDTLFERAWAKAKGTPLPSHACQAMPQPGAASFNGVLHLHGRLRDAELKLDDTDLVLTSAEFGDAYLRNGWASRYLYDVVRTHYLVLVGYGADDPPMRYLLEALEADRERFPDLKKVYAFSEPQEGDVELAAALWRTKGVEPIIYSLDGKGLHSFLYQTIREWARYAEDPTAWRRQRLAPQLAASSESTDESTIAEIANLLSHGDADRLLGEIRPSASWLPVLRRQPAFANGAIHCGHWIAGRLDDPDVVRACASLHLHDDAWRVIEWSLEYLQSKPPAEFALAWRWIKLARRAQEEARQARMQLLPDNTAATEDEFGFRAAVVELFVPRLSVRRPIVWPFHKEPEDAPVTARSLVEADFEAAGSYPPGEVLKALPADPTAEERLVLALSRALDQTLDLAREVGFIGGFDRSSMDVPSISDHIQNQNRQGFLPIVRLIAEVWTKLTASSPHRARAIAMGWQASEFTLFRRLHLYALCSATAFEPTEAAAGLLRLDDEVFWSIALRRETMVLFAVRWSQYSLEIRSKLAARILVGPPKSMFRKDAVEDADEWMSIRDRWTFIRLARIEATGAPLDVDCIAALTAIRERHPEWSAGPDDRDDFSSWVTASYGRHGNVRALSDTPDADLVNRVSQLQQEQPFENSDTWQQFCAAAPERALNDLIAEGRQGNWDSTRWREFLWAAAGIDRPEFQEAVARQIVGLPDATLVEVLPAAASWLQRCRVQIEGSEARVLDGFFDVWDRLAGLAYPGAETESSKAEDDGDVITASVNEPGGVLAEALCDSLGARELATGVGVGCSYKRRLDRALDATGRSGLLARTYLIRFLPWFHAVDPDWSMARLVPLLTSPGKEAHQLWRARLFGDSVRNPLLFNALKPSLLQQFRDPTVAVPNAEGLALAVLLPMAWKQRGEGGNWNISAIEVRTALEDAPEEVRHIALWHLWRWMESNDTAPADHAQRWSEIVGPLLRECWPQDVACRDTRTSERLVQIAVSADTAFEDALRTVLPVLVPFEVWSARQFGANPEAAAKLPRLYPRAFVELLNGIVDPDRARPPGDLGQVLAECLSADPALAQQPAYRRLHAISRRGAA